MISDAQDLEHETATPILQERKDEKSFRFILLLFPIILVALDALLYYFVDFRTGERSFLFVDAYNQGYLTWWLDIERFWANLEIWGIVGLWIGFFTCFCFGSEPGMATKSVGRVVKVPVVVLVAILVVALIFGVSSVLAPVPYSIIGILLVSWYPAFFQQQVFFLLVVFTGVWLIIPKLSKLASRRTMGPLSVRMAFAVLVVSLLILHMTVTSNWNPLSMNMIQSLLLDSIGFVFVVVPLFSFIIASTENKVHQILPNDVGSSTLTSEGHSAPSASFNNKRKWTSIGILVIASAILASIVVGLRLTVGINVRIDISSDFVPRSMLSWIVSALVAAITFLVIQGRPIKG